VNVAPFASLDRKISLPARDKTMRQCDLWHSSRFYLCLEPDKRNFLSLIRVTNSYFKALIRSCR